MSTELKPFSWERMISAMEAVRERALRATKALREAGVPHGIAGGNAVAAWVARVDEAAVRNTRDVDILVRRADFGRIQLALESVGFHYHQVMGVDRFIDGPDGSPSDAVYLLYAAEKVRPEYILPSADVTEIEPADDYDIVDLPALLTMKLNSYRRKDQMHLLDMLSVGLIDETWLEKLPPVHAERLQQLISDPDG
ncbi:MAG: hypothetical protein WBD31_11705 [Rubripirellula sp.]